MTFSLPSLWGKGRGWGQRSFSNGLLEHFYDPNSALQRCRNLLNDQGLLVLIVPNILKPYRSLDRYFLRYVHLSNFSPYTLAAMLEKHGFTVEVSATHGEEYWYQPHSLFVIARKLAEVPDDFRLAAQTADDVIEILETYRHHWKWIKGPRWHLWHRSRSMRRFIRRAVRFAGRKMRQVKP